MLHFSNFQQPFPVSLLSLSRQDVSPRAPAAYEVVSRRERGWLGRVIDTVPQERPFKLLQHVSFLESVTELDRVQTLCLRAIVCTSKHILRCPPNVSIFKCPA